MSDSLGPHEPQHTRPPCPLVDGRSPPKPMSTELVMPSSHLILCRPLLLLPSVFPSIRVFSDEPVLLIGGPNYWIYKSASEGRNQLRYSLTLNNNVLKVTKIKRLFNSSRCSPFHLPEIHCNAFVSSSLMNGYCFPKI